MRKKTIEFLMCPDCHFQLSVESTDNEIRSGEVVCRKCKKDYPILAGVLLLVSDVAGYLVEHVKGISRYVPDQEIPKKYRAIFKEAKQNIDSEHIEEDLEAERVTALYIATQYLKSNQVRSPSPVIDELIKKYWDHGPFEKISEIIKKLKTKGKSELSVVELGCGVGGLLTALGSNLNSYLGIDSSFASIAIARDLALGVSETTQKYLIPSDLLLGSVSQEVRINKTKSKLDDADFIVCDLNEPPLKEELWDVAIALNVIDMLPKPKELPKLQYRLLKKGGIAIQSSPYIWHPEVARELHKKTGKSDSALAIEQLYLERRFKIDSSVKHVPWLFFKNIRQLEIYSVHLFCASKA